MKMKRVTNYSMDAGRRIARIDYDMMNNLLGRICNLPTLSISIYNAQ